MKKEKLFIQQITINNSITINNYKLQKLALTPTLKLIGGKNGI